MARGFLRWSFNFVEKDPQIDVWRTIYQKEHIKEDDLAALAGLSTSTVKNMFGGKTKRPQFMTYQKLANATGHKYTLTRDEDERPDYAAQVPKAKQERKAYHEKQKKRREKGNGKKRP